MEALHAVFLPENKYKEPWEIPGDIYLDLMILKKPVPGIGSPLKILLLFSGNWLAASVSLSQIVAGLTLIGHI